MDPNTVAAVRAADASITAQALESEFRAWWRAQGWPTPAPGPHAISTHVAWAQHVLRRGREVSDG